MAHKIDSLKKRYFFKLFSNTFTQGISVVIQAMVIRGLGPKLYGDFNLLSNFFTQITNFFDMGTSTVFYTKLSQRMKQVELVIFYRYYTIVVSFLMLSLVVIAHLSSVYPVLWPGQNIPYIYLGAGFGILSWIVNILNKMTDAYGITVSAESGRVIQKILGLVLIAALYLSGCMNLANYFYYQYVTLLFLVLAFTLVIKHSRHVSFYGGRLTLSQLKSYAKEFYDYGHPLFTALSFGLVVPIFDRWLLQIFGGSVQQGFFGISYQIGVVCIIFTSSMTPLFMREFSIAFGNNDIENMKSLFRKNMQLLFSITAFLSCFIATQADSVVRIMGGAKYIASIPTVIVMAFYPIHQTYGQLSSSLMLAAGQTRLYRNIAIAFSVLGLILSYLLIAPRQYFGMGAGATGLAVKMVVVQLFCVNVQLYFNTKFLKFSFWLYLVHQILCISSLLLIGIAMKVLSNNILLPSSNILVRFLSSGILYTFIVICLVYVKPGIFGLTAETVRNIKTGFYNNAPKP